MGMDALGLAGKMDGIEAAATLAAAAAAAVIGRVVGSVGGTGID